MTTQRKYESLVILKHVGGEQELARSTTQIEELIKKIGGSVAGSQDMGRRRLAFRIARQIEGSYHLLRFTAPTDRIAELERLFRLNEAIIRFIILSEDEHIKSPSRAAGRQVAGVTSAADTTRT